MHSANISFICLTHGVQFDKIAAIDFYIAQCNRRTPHEPRYQQCEGDHME